MDQFRRIGIACCHRLEVGRNDKRLGKALRLLEKFLGPPLDDKLRRDAYNAANPVYMERIGDDYHVDAVSCTVVCASLDIPNGNLLGNFRTALAAKEGLSLDEIFKIEKAIFQRVLGD